MSKIDFKNLFSPILAGLIVAGLFSAVFYVLAVPPDSKYLFSEILNPTCTPGSTNCAVESPAVYSFGSNNFSGTGSFTTTGSGTFGELYIDALNGMLKVTDSEVVVATAGVDYEDPTNKNQPNGYPGLDENGDLVGIFIPRIDTAANMASVILEAGELATTSDTQVLLLGDGTTPGGVNAITSSLASADITTTGTGRFDGGIGIDTDASASYGINIAMAGSTIGLSYENSEVGEQGRGYGIYNNITMNEGLAQSYGIYNLITSGGNYTSGYGSYNEIIISGSDAYTWGSYNTITVSGDSADGYGTYNTISSSIDINQKIYGTYNSITPHSPTVTAYGEYIQSTTTTNTDPAVNQIGLYINWKLAGTDTSNKKWAIYNASTNTTAGKVFLGRDDVKTYWGTGYDGSIYVNSDNFYIANSTQDKDLVFSVNDGGATKTITWDADVDKLKHSSGTFDFDDDNIATTGSGTFGELYIDALNGMLKVTDSEVVVATAGVDYEDPTNKNQPNGYPGLDENGDLVGIFIPRIDTAANMASVVLEAGELATTSDTQVLLLGDGTTPGGLNLIENYLDNTDISTTTSARFDGGFLFGLSDFPPESLKVAYAAQFEADSEFEFDYVLYNNIAISGTEAIVNGVYNNMIPSGEYSSGFGVYNYMIVRGNNASGFGVYNILTSGTNPSQTIYGVNTTIQPHAPNVTAVGEYIKSSTSTVNNPTADQIGLYIDWKLAGTDTSNKRWAIYNASTNTTAGKVFLGLDDTKTYWGTGYDGSIYVNSDNFYIANSTQDKDLIFSVNDGGATKTITWDADVDKLKHSSGTFDFDDDNITTTGIGTFSGGIITNYGTSAPELTTNGQIAVSYEGEAARIRFYANGTSYYIDKTGGFGIPAEETFDPISGEKMEIGDIVLGMINQNLGDKEDAENSSLHGIWVKWDSIKAQLLAEARGELSRTTGAWGAGTVTGVETETLLNRVTNVLVSLGISVQNGITNITNLVTEKFSAKTARMEKIEMVATNGDIYCTWIGDDGEWQKVKGECASIAVAVVITEEPILIETPEIETPETITEEIVQQATEQAVQQAQQAAELVFQQASQQQERVTEKVVEKAVKIVKEEIKEEIKEELEEILLEPLTPPETPFEELVPEEELTEEEEAEQPPIEELVPDEILPESEKESEPSIGDIIQDSAAGLLNSMWEFLKGMIGLGVEKISSASIIKKASAGLSQTFSQIKKEIGASLQETTPEIVENSSAGLLNSFKNISEQFNDLWQKIENLIR